MIPNPFIVEIQMEVSAEYGIAPTEMKARSRVRAVSRPRQVAMFLARALTSRSTPEIGRAFGGRDHSTVIHAIRKVEHQLSNDGQEADRVRMICADVAKRVAARPLVEEHLEVLARRGRRP